MTARRQITRREFVGATVGGAAAAAGWAALASPARGQPAPAPRPAGAPGVSGAAGGSGGSGVFWLYVMDTGLGGLDIPALEDKVKLAKELGFAGIDFQLNHKALPRQLELLDQHGLELSALYLTTMIETTADAALAESIARLKGRPTRLELAITSKQFKPSDTAGDTLGVELVRRVADLAGDTGPMVSIYPHKGMWTERIEDGLRLTKLAERKNVGTNFNLVHWKWCAQLRPVEELLASALPHLLTVTICGLAGTGDRIVPLDQSDFDVAGFLATLKRAGYRGRVGLQCWSIPGPSRTHLTASMARWRQWLKGLE